MYPLSLHDALPISGIVEGDLDIEMTEIAPAVALGPAESFRVWMAVVIEPRALGETVGFDDQRVAVPASHGVSHPTRIRILGELPAVQVNLAIREVLDEDHDERGRLDELEVEERRRDGRRTKRQA